MHILFLSQVLPYPIDAGPKMRSYFVLRHLAQKHQVTLLTFVRDTDRREDIAHLAEFCHAVHTVPMRRTRVRDVKFLIQSLLTQQPFLIIRDQIPEMNEKIRQLVTSEAFEVVHADQLWMAQYALKAKDLSPSSKIIVDQHNAVYLIPRRLAESDSNPLKQRFLAREAKLLTRYEPEICHRFDHVVWVTKEDYQAVAALPGSNANGQISSTVIPICANPAQVKPVERISSQSCRITFLGGLHWPPNAQGILWFAKQVFPRVKAEIPEAVLTVIGKNPPAGLEGEGVEITGYVVDPVPYLTETAAFIVPLHAGGGMRVKILDAWSWGLPVVSTTIGAEGIETEPGKNILIADTAETFAQAVIRCLREPELAQLLGQNGRQTILEKYNWQVIYPAWDEVYNRVIRAKN
ncbi:MAG: glycosyl transferase family 1 [Anaerolineae bacterium]|nr:glycosyltransferase [Anaerolineales bacterium]MCQ3975430.1 glycosyl transferase family 1 [Anaerolineae bacterium]